MKPSELFGVVVRGFGLYAMLNGLHSLAWGIFFELGLVDTASDTLEGISSADYALDAIFYIAAGVLLIRGTWLVKICYPDNEGEKFQFSVRSLLIFMTLIAIALGLIFGAK
jgi:hypothetical protein